MSRIDSQHRKISTGRHFRNDHHNAAKNQHCPISSKFDMWVDNDVPTLKIFLAVAIFKMVATMNFYRPFFIPCFGSHFENGRHLENFENAELLL
jgi:hypothetical protein